MKMFDRSLTAGLITGLILCFAVSLISMPSAVAEDGKPEPRERESVESGDRFEADDDDDDKRAERSRREQERMRNRPIASPRDFQRDGREREIDERERGEREMQRREQQEREMQRREMHEREMHEREMRERELHERELHERERQMRDGQSREHQPHGPEMRERERMEREQLERREREGHERREAHHPIEREMLDLELRRKHLELRMVEIELEQRVLESTSKMDEVAFDAIEQATRYMDAAHAAEFFADTVDHVRSPIVKKRLRLQLAELLFQSKQPDRAVEQLRMLIVPAEHGGH